MNNREDLFHFTLKFDDEELSLTPHNAFNVKLLAELLTRLHDALNISNEEDEIILSEIKSNCYAPTITTASSMTNSNLHSLHQKISESDYKGFGTKQKAYAKTIGKIVKKGIYLDVYNPDKSFIKRIREVNIKEEKRIISENDTIVGMITRIGSRNLDGNAMIHITNQDKEVEVSAEDEEKLLKYFKKRELRFNVTKTYELKGKNIQKIELNSFQVLERSSFVSAIHEFRENYGEKFFENLQKETE